METRLSPTQIRPSWLRRQAGRLLRYAEKANKGLDKVGSWLFPNPEALLGYRPVVIDGPATNILLMESDNLSGTGETTADSPDDLIKLKNDILGALREKERYDEADLQVLEKSFDFMIRYHGKEATPAGERTALFLVEVARNLAAWGCNPIVVSAGLLHLTPLKKLEKENIDQHVIYLVQRKDALSEFLFIPMGEENLSERKEEAGHLTKMCLMQEGDRDVWLLEAAEEFTTLSSQIGFEGKRQKMLSSRAYHVTSSILKLSDLDDLAVKLEDIALMRLDEKEYRRIEGIITDTNKRERLIALEQLRTITELISEELDRKGIKHRVQIDVKSVARAKEKLERGDKLTDASRFRFIIDGSREQCKEAMEIIKWAMESLGHSEDLSERKNYIAGIEIGTIKNPDGTVTKSKLLSEVPEIKKKLSWLFKNPREEILIFKPKIEKYIKEMEEKKEQRDKLLSIINKMVKNQEQQDKLLSILEQPPDGTPKRNKYESIHLHFRGEEYEPINVQIRTEEIHKRAELGSASHGRFKYKLNGMIADAIVDEASAERQKLIDCGQRYGMYDGHIYELVPYPSGRKLKITDLLIAISKRHVLRAPYRIRARRIDPETGASSETWLQTKFTLFENGDQILGLDTSRKVRLFDVRLGDISTLPGQVAHRLANVFDLNPEAIDERSSRAASRGKRALNDKLSNLKRELRARMTAVLKGDGENPNTLEISAPLSMDLAAVRLGAASPEEMYLKAGLIRRQENFIDHVIRLVQSSSAVATFKVIEETGNADLWLLYPESLGALPAVINLLKNRFRKLLKLSCRRFKGYVLIKARVKGKKKSIEEDAGAFISEIKDLHNSSRQIRREGKQIEVRMEWRLGSLDMSEISMVAEILQKVGANIVSANFPEAYEARVNCNLSVEIPLGKYEAFQNRLKRAGITGLNIV